jgi:diguanylate cyclase (GGDEF)-like protein
LAKLISLTNERDVAALELSLAQALFDLIAPVESDGAKSVVIYRVVDISKQIFSMVVVGEKSKETHLSVHLKQALSDCFKSGVCHSYEQEGESSATLYPLTNVTGHVMAIIAIEASLCDPHLHETIGMLLQIYQNFTGLINDNEHDTLTGLLNRKTFEHKVNKVLAHMHKAAKRKDDKPGRVHFLAIFDIDHFKNVNDEFGHLIGDEVLLMFSQLMTQTFREKDLLFRFGGEEFVVVFECASVADIECVLDRFREKVSSFEFPQVGKVTVSSGYTEISAYDGSSQLIDRADLALYYAKNNGRNRICFYEQLIADGALRENKKEGDVELF